MPERWPQPGEPMSRRNRAALLASVATATIGVVVWIVGHPLGVVLVTLGVLLAGFWGVRRTRGADPDDPGQYWPGSAGLP